MTEEMDNMGLRDRVALIESMIAEGRRTTESWGWIFVLWGVAYYVAIGWAMWGKSNLAWPVTMIAASVVSGVVGSRKKRKGSATTAGRAIGAVWIAVGSVMFAIFISLGISGRLEDQGLYVALAAAMLGTANLASALILRWKLQFACAVAWLVTAVTACFVKGTQAMIVFVAAIFLCQIVFGFYGMSRDSGQRKLRGESHGPAHA